ncbi:MAG TPA: hypothetical protein DD979_02835 [Gammaproteobacteria bacterium]|nr:hypothetical protein [Gammaproteobacteria bacterium]
MKTGGLYAATTANRDRRLAIKNMHTGEYLDEVYWHGGDYLPEAAGAFNHLMRDHRRDETCTMDPALLDLLNAVHRHVDAPFGIELYSGYRSPETNRELRKHNKGVAKKSYHMRGMAADIRIPGVSLEATRKAAIALGRGGVGYYAKSGFIHVDTGWVRHWCG